MSLTTGEMTPADFAAVTGNRNDGFDGDGWWIILFLILAMNGGWGNGFGGNGGGVPFVDSSIQRGFDQSAVMSGINNLTSDVCNGFAGVNQSLANGFAQAEIAANGRQMANMNQNFGMQTAMMQGFNGMESQFADCLKKIIKKAKDSLVFTKYAVGSCAA